MFMKNLAALPALFFISACLGGGNTTPAPAPVPANLTGGAGSAALSAGETAKAENVTQLLAVDFDGSATGSTVTIEEFVDLTGVSIKIKEKVAGQSTILVSGQSDDGKLSQTISSENMQLLLKGQNRLKDVVKVEEPPRINIVNGLDIVALAEDADLGTTKMQDGYIAIKTGNESIFGSFTAITDGTDSTSATGSGRIGDIDFTAPTVGDFTYEGTTAVFTADNAYESTASTVTINFADLTGSYSADTFKNGNGVAVILSVESDIKLNNTDGTISGSGGSITFGNATGEMEVQGVMSGDNAAVAGAFVTNPITAGGVVGGAFAVAKNP